MLFWNFANRHGGSYKEFSIVCVQPQKEIPQATKSIWKLKDTEIVIWRVGPLCKPPRFIYIDANHAEEEVGKVVDREEEVKKKNVDLVDLPQPKGTHGVGVVVVIVLVVVVVVVKGLWLLFLSLFSSSWWWWWWWMQRKQRFSLLEQVTRDLELWWPILASGGLMAGQWSSTVR